MSDNALVPYAEMQHMAKAIATSGLFGIKTPEQAIALMLIAQAEGLHPAVVARDYYIVNGRPAKTSEAMLRAFIAAGGTVQWHELTDVKAEATFSHPQGGTVKIDWTMQRAKTAGLSTRKNRDGSDNMYERFPRQMLRARCISEGVRTICPTATSGLYSPEEVGEFSEPINIATRRRTGSGWTTRELPPPDAIPNEHEGETDDITDSVSGPAKQAAAEPVTKGPVSPQKTAKSPLPPPKPVDATTKAAMTEWTSSSTAALLMAMEGAMTLASLKELGERAKQVPEADQATLREIYVVRQKQLKAKMDEEPKI